MKRCSRMGVIELSPYSGFNTASTLSLIPISSPASTAIVRVPVGRSTYAAVSVTRTCGSVAIADSNATGSR